MRAPRMTPYSLYEPSSRALMRGYDPHKATNESLCATMFQTLLAAYPGHYWVVRADAEQGIAGVKIHQLMGDTLWWNIKLDDYSNHNDFLKVVKRAGGEILERYNIPRSGIDFGAFLTARAMTPMRPGPKDPIPEGDLRIFNPKPKPELPRDLPEELRTLLEGAAKSEAA